MGAEDQGWIAWFLIAAETGAPITIYGDGKQVRDVLCVDDLIDVYLRVLENIDTVQGQAFNVGGGPDNTLSLLEFISHIDELRARPLEYGHGDWRPGDQRVYVSDIRKLERVLGWSPKIKPEQGIAQLHRWVIENKDLFQSPASASSTVELPELVGESCIAPQRIQQG